MGDKITIIEEAPEKPDNVVIVTPPPERPKAKIVTEKKITTTEVVED